MYICMCVCVSQRAYRSSSFADRKWRQREQVCMYGYMYLCVCVCLSQLPHENVCMYTNLNMYTCVYIRMNASICMYVYVCVCMYV
jgi:hypothetical protein